MIRFATVDRVYDGQLVQSCEFCYADINWSEHDIECQRLQASYIANFGADDLAGIAVSSQLPGRSYNR